MGEREKTIKEKVSERAFALDRDYGFCSQAVLAALQDYFGIIDDSTIKAGTALSGGGGLCGGGSCGALSGGLVAISAVFGREREEFGLLEEEKRLKSCKISKTLYDKFIEEYGSAVCRDVQERVLGRSFDLWDPEEHKLFKEALAEEDKCAEVAGKVAGWVTDIFLNEGIEPGLDRNK